MCLLKSAGPAPGRESGGDLASERSKQFPVYVDAGRGRRRRGFFLARDLPADIKARNAFLLSVMGSPDLRQIDGMGGADPLTSKVAVVKKSEREGVDFGLFVFAGDGRSGGCNRLHKTAEICSLGVGPFAIERRACLPPMMSKRLSLYLWKIPAKRP